MKGDFIAMDYDIKIMINNIIALMENHHVTQNDLAEILHTHQSRISKCLKCEGYFTITQLVTIASHFNVSVDSLLEIKKENSEIKKQPETYADVFQMLFSLNDFFDMHVEYGDFYKHDDESLRTYAIHFNNKTITDFLKEWNSILLICKTVTGADMIYDTWKHGILEKYNYKLPSIPNNEPLVDGDGNVLPFC